MRERLILIGAALIAFGASIASGFHFDDFAIFTDPIITSPEGWWKCWGLLQTRPLTWFSFWVNYQAAGSNPLTYHLINIFLHVAVVVALFEALGDLIPRPAAFIAAGLFAIHPMQTEAVAYVFARGTLLNTLLCLIALRYWIKGRHWASVAWFALALLAKEECVTFPLVLGLLSLSRALKSPPWRPIAVMLVLALAAGLRGIFATSVIAGAAAGFAAGIAPARYFLSQGVVILRYLRLLVVPWGFTIDPEIRLQNAALELAAWAAVAILCGLALRRFSRAQEGFWILAGLVLLIPSSSIFPAADLAADRRMYLPMIAFAAAAGLFARNWRPWILASIGVSLLALSVQRTQVWRSNESLWSEAVRRAPGKVRPRLQLSRAVEPQRALPILEETKRIAPDDPAVASELGRVWLEVGRPGQALAEFGRALALAPSDAHALNNRGVALRQLGQEAAAQRDFKRALEIDPQLDDARRNLTAAK